MSKPKHTPGPWRFDKETNTIRVMRWENVALMGDFCGCIIADFNASRIPTRDDSQQEQEANARLIAKAWQIPEIAKLLEQILDAGTVTEVHYQKGKALLAGLED